MRLATVRAGGRSGRRCRLRRTRLARARSRKGSSTAGWLRGPGVDLRRLGPRAPVGLEADVVVDSRGGENLERSLTVLKPGGQAIGVSGPPDRRDRRAARGAEVHRRRDRAAEPQGPQAGAQARCELLVRVPQGIGLASPSLRWQTLSLRAAMRQCQRGEAPVWMMSAIRCGSVVKPPRKRSACCSAVRAASANVPAGRPVAAATASRVGLSR